MQNMWLKCSKFKNAVIQFKRFLFSKDKKKSCTCIPVYLKKCPIEISEFYWETYRVSKTEAMFEDFFCDLNSDRSTQAWVIICNTKQICKPRCTSWNLYFVFSVYESLNCNMKVHILNQALSIFFSSILKLFFSNAIWPSPKRQKRF